MRRPKGGQDIRQEHVLLCCTRKVSLLRVCGIKTGAKEEDARLKIGRPGHPGPFGATNVQALKGAAFILIITFANVDQVR